MSKKKNTLYDFELETGEIVKLTLTYIGLYKLKAKNKATYDAYNAIMVKGPKEELDNMQILYTAYLCGLIDQNGNTDVAMGFEEFLSEVTPDREYINNTIKALIAPKKAQASATPSN